MLDERRARGRAHPATHLRILAAMSNAPSLPTVTGPITGGLHGWPFGGPILDIAALCYREDEYFLEGEATRFRPAPGTEFARDGRWQAEPAGTAQCKTRMTVYRHIDPARFNGTVVVTWNNVTSEYDHEMRDITGFFGNRARTTERWGRSKNSTKSSNTLFATRSRRDWDQRPGTDHTPGHGTSRATWIERSLASFSRTMSKPSIR